MIRNCPITIQDIEIAEKVYGKSVGALKNKTVRVKPDPVVTNYVAVPPDITNNNKYVTLSCDIMYVQQILFFITVSCNLHFMTIENIPNRKAQTLIACCDNVFNLYNSHGFVIENFFNGYGV